MKPSIAITLIVVGALLMLAPFVYASYNASLVAHLLATKNIDNVDINPNVGLDYQWACFFAGLAAAITGVVRSVPHPSSEPMPIRTASTKV
jgi:hypothetical protein